MSDLFHRRASVVLDDVQFDSVQEDDSPGFRISFEVIHSNDSDANKASAIVHNLSESSRARFADAVTTPVVRPPPLGFEGLIPVATLRPSTPIRFAIEAGYVETKALIFDGEAVHVTSARVTAGFETKVSAADGLQARRGIVSAALNGPQSIGKVFEKVAKSMKVNAERAVAKALSGEFDGAMRQFFSGVTIQGPADRVMNQLAQSAGFEWSIQDGELVVLTPDGFVDEEVIQLGPLSGLIQSPERRRDEKTHKEIVVVRSLLQPRMRVGRKVEIESREISGLFRIELVRHTGDTSGSDWYSEAEVVSV